MASRSTTVAGAPAKLASEFEHPCVRRPSRRARGPGGIGHIGSARPLHRRAPLGEGSRCTRAAAASMTLVSGLAAWQAVVGARFAVRTNRSRHRRSTRLGPDARLEPSASSTGPCTRNTGLEVARCGVRTKRRGGRSGDPSRVVNSAARRREHPFDAGRRKNGLDSRVGRPREYVGSSAGWRAWDGARGCSGAISARFQSADGSPTHRNADVIVRAREVTDRTARTSTKQPRAAPNRVTNTTAREGLVRAGAPAARRVNRDHVVLVGRAASECGLAYLIGMSWQSCTLVRPADNDADHCRPYQQANS